MTDYEKLKYMARALEVIMELCESPVSGWSCKETAAKLSRETLERLEIEVKPNPWIKPLPPNEEP